MKPQFGKPAKDEAARLAREAAAAVVWLYVCAGCGAECRQHWWQALELDAAEERCPGCGRWEKFAVKTRAAGEKAA